MGRKNLSGHRRCWALSCGTDAFVFPNLRFFKFPSNEQLCLQWVKLCGNSTLLLDTHAVLQTNRALCSKHFPDNRFRVHGNLASGLNRNALPSIFTQPAIPDSCLPTSLLKAGSFPQPLVSIPPSLDAENVPPPVLVDCSTVVPNSPVASISGNTSSPPPVLVDVVPSPMVASTSGNGNTSSSQLSAPGESSQVFVTPVPVPSCTLKRKVLSVISDSSLNKRRRLDFTDDSGVSSPPCDALATSTPAVPPLCKSSSSCNTSKRVSTLSAYGLHKSDITPKKKVLIEDTKLLRAQIRSLRRSLEAVRDNQKTLKKFANQPVVHQLRRSMKTREGAILMEAQIANHGKKPKGFRWSLEQKTLGLALYKNAKKNYSFLRKILHLPGRTCVLSLMSRVKFETGSNKHFFDHLKKVIKDFTPMERVCVLMWDEVHMMKAFSYNEQKDKIVGNVDYGDGVEQREAANKALVFMVQSLGRKWKQPVAYYFSQDETPGLVLKRLIVSVIVSLQEVGFDVRATISDMGSNNRLAVSELKQNFATQTPKAAPLCGDCKRKKADAAKASKRRRTLLASGVSERDVGPKFQFTRMSCSVCRATSFRPSLVTHYRVFSKVNIYHIWDAPHLLKQLRSNFQTYNVQFDEGKVAKFSHIEQLKLEETENGTFFHLTLKLTDAHLKPTKNAEKMKVSMAAQILSAKVASSLEFISKFSDGKAIPGCKETGEFVRFADQLFDSFNGNGGRKRSGKPLRVNLSDDSPHFKFWEEAEVKIKKLWFVGSSRIFPSTVGWVENMASMKELWADLKKDLDFKFLNLRKLNQDPLENLFSVIKSNGHKLPTVPQFIGGLKTAIVTNLRNSGIRGANCEDDGGTLLTDLNVFFRAASDDGGEEGGQLPEEEQNEDPFCDDELVHLSHNVPVGLSAPQSSAEVVHDEWNELDALFADVTGNAEQSDSQNVVVKQEGFDPLDDLDDMLCDAASLQVGGNRQNVVTVCLEDDCHCGLHNVQSMDAITLDNIRTTAPNRRRKKKPSQVDDATLGQNAVDQENRGLFGNRRKLTAYVAGFMVKKSLARVKCAACESTMTTDKPNEDHDLVVAFEHSTDKARLTYASDSVIDITVASVDIFLRLMHTHFFKSGLKSAICDEILRTTSVSRLGCLEHALEVQRLVMLYFCRVCIYHRIRILNRVFAKSWQNQMTINSLPANERGRNSRAHAPAPTDDCSISLLEGNTDEPDVPDALLDF